jgi:hypothetical protein
MPRRAHGALSSQRRYRRPARGPGPRRIESRLMHSVSRYLLSLERDRGTLTVCIGSIRCLAATFSAPSTSHLNAILPRVVLSRTSQAVVPSMRLPIPMQRIGSLHHPSTSRSADAARRLWKRSAVTVLRVRFCSSDRDKSLDWNTTSTIAKASNLAWCVTFNRWRPHLSGTLGPADTARGHLMCVPADERFIDGSLRSLLFDSPATERQLVRYHRASRWG